MPYVDSVNLIANYAYIITSIWTLDINRILIWIGGELSADDWTTIVWKTTGESTTYERWGPGGLNIRSRPIFWGLAIVRGEYPGDDAEWFMRDRSEGLLQSICEYPYVFQ
jgi:hypothetical protein